MQGFDKEDLGSPMKQGVGLSPASYVLCGVGQNWVTISQCRVTEHCAGSYHPTSRAY